MNNGKHISLRENHDVRRRRTVGEAQLDNPTMMARQREDWEQQLLFQM